MRDALLLLAERNPLLTAEALGWRARVGLILPADNVVTEPELGGLALHGVSFHGLRLTSTVPEVMRRQAVELAVAIGEMGLDVAVYTCAETSFNGGAESRATLAALIGDRCGVPVVTATNAMIEACAALGLRTPSVVTPYTAESGATFERTLTEHGMRPRRTLHRDFSREGDDPREWFLTNRQPLSTVDEMARRADTPESDGIVIAATNLPALGVVHRLETDLGKPIVSSNQSILWWCLRTLGITTADIPLGALMRQPLTDARR